jgi:hypothetical protein
MIANRRTREASLIEFLIQWFRCGFQPLDFQQFLKSTEATG